MTSRVPSSSAHSEPLRRLLALAVLLLLPVALPAQDAAARQYYARARQLADSGEADRAIAEYQRAIAADDANWRYPYALGELYQDRLQRWADALAAFRSAWGRGYQRGITRHRIGVSQYQLGQPEQALAEFERAIAMNREALDTASSTSVLLRYQLADSHLWAARIRMERRETEAAYRSAVAAFDYDARREQRGRILSLGHIAFGDADYEFATRFYTLSLRDPATGAPLRDLQWDDFPDWRIPTDVLLEVVDNRRRLGRIEPEYTHSVLALLILDQDVEVEQDGQRVRVHRVNGDRQRRESEARLRWLRQVLESLSDGKYSLSFVLAEDSTPYRYSAPTRPSWIGDRRIISAHVDSIDTLIRLWPYGEGLGSGGSMGLSLQPVRPISVRRGTVNINAELSYGMWIHEFFHVVEAMARISPTHGYYDEQRGSFPGWTGRKNAQLDYFRWHFRTTLPPIGWASLNFRVEYPVRSR